MPTVYPQRWVGAQAAISWTAMDAAGVYMPATRKTIVGVKNTSGSNRTVRFLASTGSGQSLPLIEKDYISKIDPPTSTYGIGDKVPADLGRVMPAAISGLFELIVAPTSEVLIPLARIFLIKNIEGDPADQIQDDQHGRYWFDCSGVDEASLQVANVSLPIDAKLFYHEKYQSLLFPQT